MAPFVYSFSNSLIYSCLIILASQSEKGSIKTSFISLNLFLLETQLFIAVATGELKRGRGSKAGQGIPDSITIDENSFLEKGRSRFLPILQAMPNGSVIYRQLVDAMFKKDMGLFYKLYDQILTFLINYIAP